MAVKVSYPGVYIEEFAPAGPIQPAATNVAAFLGPLAKGPVYDPDGPYQVAYKVTSFDQFKTQYGARPPHGYFTWYAVRGFFENGGTACYVTRVSNAQYAKTELQNAANVKIGEVMALVPGEIDTAIQFVVQDPATPVLPAGTKLFAVTVSGDLKGSEITIPKGADPGNGPPQDGRAFRVGDWVQVIGAAGTSLGPLTQVKSVTATSLIVDERYTDQAVQVKLMYNPGGDIRVIAPGVLPAGALGPGTTIILGDPNDPNHLADVVDSSSGEQLTALFRTYRLTLRDGLIQQTDPSADVLVTAVTFDVSISQNGSAYVFTNLAPDPVSDRYYVNVINKYPSLVSVVTKDPPPAVDSPEGLRPANRAFTVVGGKDESLPELTDDDFITALDNIRAIRDVRLVSLPDAYPRPTGVKPELTAAVQASAVAHCEQMGDRFAVIDPEPDLEAFGENGIEKRRAALDSARGYAALYYPWVRVNRVGSGPPVLVPPSGHVCGLMARVDDTRGVHKAPANEPLQGTLAVETDMTDSDHGLLNLQGINVIRVFREGSLPVVYGARTTATDSNWIYVNVRRLFLYLEKSIQDSIRWAVFEPNNQDLWGKLRQSIGSFLLTEWQAGALFGASPKEAYYVRIDDKLNSSTDRKNGKLTIEIGIQPAYPAEFIIVRIGIWDGGSQVTEG
jgi:hypothetical protein